MGVVRFEAGSKLAEVAIETKNTFIHFGKRDPLARRQTCSGALLSARRGSAERTGRRQAVRGNTRAVTYQPHVVAVVQIPELSLAGLRRDSVVSASSACSSRRSSVCYADTPTHEGSMTSMSFTPRSSGCLTPMNLMQMQCASPMSFYSQGAPTPVHADASRFGFTAACPPSPCQTASPFAFVQQIPQYSPPCSPRAPPTSPCMSPVMQSMAPQYSLRPTHPEFPEAWQPLHAENAKPKQKKKNKKSKTVLPAKENEWTLLLRHLPLDYTQDSLLDELEGFLQWIDFYYLPTNFETKNNLGYAFVNFCDKAAAARFKVFWEQSGIPEMDEMPVQDARMQGWAANVESLRNSSVMGVLSEDLKPRVFCNGVQQRFPEPAKQLPPVGARFKPTVE